MKPSPESKVFGRIESDEDEESSDSSAKGDKGIVKKRDSTVSLSPYSKDCKDEELFPFFWSFTQHLHKVATIGKSKGLAKDDITSRFDVLCSLLYTL